MKRLINLIKSMVLASYSYNHLLHTGKLPPKKWQPKERG